jgi:chemotaxis protein MotB
MKKNKKKAGESKMDGWLATYADMVTLLFAFFVLMTAISAMDNEKFALFFASIQSGGLTEDQFVQIRNTHREMSDPPYYICLACEERERQEARDAGLEDEDELEIDENLLDLYDIIQAHIIEYEMENYMYLHDLDGYSGSISFVLRGDVWFESGSADIRESARVTAERLGRLLGSAFDEENNPFDIYVIGHTDNVPQNSPEFRNNWQLGAGRAHNFLELLMEISGISPVHFQQSSHAAYRPLSDDDAVNNSPEGRQANRRVEVRISPKRSATASQPQSQAAPGNGAGEPEPETATAGG